MINRFVGDYRFLSNFYPVEIYFENEWYHSVEHAYQAAKTLNLDLRKSIQNAPAPQLAKSLGRKLPLREDWEKVKIGIMWALVSQKFQYATLRMLLNSTKPHELVEGNWWGDKFWGVCNGVGENHLGKILMSVRDNPPSYLRYSLPQVH